MPPHRMQVGPLAVELSLDPALEAVFRAPAPAEGAAEVRVELSSGDPGRDVAPFGASGKLQATGISLLRDGSTVRGTCVPSGPVLARAVRFALQPFLLERGWLLLHGSSAVLADGAHVFAAPSGTGKTTLLHRLAEADAPVLGDEVALVSAERAAVFPVQPVPGKAGVFAPLAAVHFLAQGGPSSEPLGERQALARILEMAMVYEDGPAAAARALEVAAQIAAKNWCFRTKVPNDARAAEHVMALAGAKRAA